MATNLKNQGKGPKNINLRLLDGEDDTSGEAGGWSRSRSPSRSRSRSPRHSPGRRQLTIGDVAGVGTKLSKMEKKKKKREEKGRMEKEKEKEKFKMNVDSARNSEESEVDEKKELRGAKIGKGSINELKKDNVKMSEGKKKGGMSLVGLDRAKGGNKELYVVCERIDGNIRKIKKEVMDDQVKESVIDAGEQYDFGQEPPLKPFPLMRDVTKKIRDILLSEANKVTRFVADAALSCLAEYEGIIQSLVLENARLQGRLEAHQGMSGKLAGLTSATNDTNENMMKVCEKVCSLAECVSKEVARMGEVSIKIDGKLNEMERKIDQLNQTNVVSMDVEVTNGTNVRQKGKTYAVILKGANEELSSNEVQQRLGDVMVGGENVRVKKLRPVRGGGVVIETPSDVDRRLLTQNAGLSEAGLRVEEPKRSSPRVIIYDVPNEMTSECFLNGLYEKNVSDIIGRDEFTGYVKIIRRMGKRGSETANVIVELPKECKVKLLNEKRVYVEWTSFRVRVWEHVPRCFVCTGYGHVAKECKAAKVCWRCGISGHLAAACRGPGDCRNCRARRQPSGHSAMSSTCPEYLYRLQRLRQMCDNG